MSSDYRPGLDRLSTDYRPLYRPSLDRLATDRLSTECRPTIDCSIDRYISVDTTYRTTQMREKKMNSYVVLIMRNSMFNRSRSPYSPYLRVPISSRQKLQSLNDYTMNIHIDGVPINQSNQSKSLGLIIDENLSWKAHIHEISKKCILWYRCS